MELFLQSYKLAWVNPSGGPGTRVDNSVPVCKVFKLATTTFAIMEEVDESLMQAFTELQGKLMDQAQKLKLVRLSMLFVMFAIFTSFLQLTYRYLFM